MRKKYDDYKSRYTEEEHALEMFDKNAEYFDLKKEEFDIFPYSERYYRDNKKYFHENDKIEIRVFIQILKDKGYIEEAEKAFNIVRITEKGIKRISDIKER